MSFVLVDDCRKNQLEVSLLSSSKRADNTIISCSYLQSEVHLPALAVRRLVPGILSLLSLS